MADDYASHRRFHVYALAGEGTGANDPGALTDEEAEKAVVAYVWPEFAEVRLFPRDDFEQYATPFEHGFSSLLLGRHGIAAPIVDESGVVTMYVGWFDHTRFHMPSDMINAFRAAETEQLGDGGLLPVYNLEKQWMGQMFISRTGPGPGMGDPMLEPEMSYLALTTADGTVMQLLSAHDTVGDMSTIQPLDFLAAWLAGIARAGLAALDYLLAEDTIVELGTSRLVGSVSADEMLFHLNRIEASSAELGQLRVARALTGNPLQQRMRGIWADWAKAGTARQVQYLTTQEMVARGVGSTEVPNLISLRPLAGNPRGLALINSMVLDPGFEGEFFDETLHEFVANALGWSGSGGADVMAFIGDEFRNGVNTAQAILEAAIKTGRSIEEIVASFR